MLLFVVKIARYKPAQSLNVADARAYEGSGIYYNVSGTLKDTQLICSSELVHACSPGCFKGLIISGVFPARGCIQAFIRR